MAGETRKLEVLGQQQVRVTLTSGHVFLFEPGDAEVSEALADEVLANGGGLVVQKTARKRGRPRKADAETPKEPEEPPAED